MKEINVIYLQNSVNGENGLVFKIARTKINQNFLALKYDISGASTCAKRAWDRAPYSWNMVNLL